MLDAYDKKLLFALDQSARKSYTQLGKIVGLSKDGIRYRMENYRTSGLVDGYYALIDASKLGFYPIRFYCKLRATTPIIENQIISFLKRQPNVWWLARTHGFCDVAGGIWVKSLEEFQAFWLAFRTKYARYVTEPKHGIFIKLLEFPRRYLTNSKTMSHVSLTFSRTKEEIDQVDLQILNALAKDGRASATSLVKNLTPGAVIARIKDLERRKIIVAYKAKINTEQYGYALHNVLITLGNAVSLRELRSHVLSLQNLWHYQEVFGGLDFEFGVEVRSEVELLGIFDKLREKFGTAIERISHYGAKKVHTIKYFPESRICSI